MYINRHYQATEFITGLRAIAAIMVFIIHSGGGGLLTLSDASNRFVHWGKFGVEIFFVISGFTIFYQIYKRDYSLKAFLAVRITRISIPYWPLLIIVYLYINLTGEVFNDWSIKFNNGDIDLVNLIMHFTYLSAYDIRYQTTILGVEWTLAIEVFYYLLLGWIILKIKKLKNLDISIIFMLGILMFFIYDIAQGIDSANEKLWLYIHWSPLKYGFMFMMGGAGYFVREQLEHHLQKNTLLIISDISIITLVAIFITGLNLNFVWNPEIFVVYITFFAISLIRDEGYFSKILTNPVLLYIGSISYSFYLWHFIVLKVDIFSLTFFSNNILLNFIYKLVLTIAISSIWYTIFEYAIYRKIKFIIQRNL